MAGKYGESGLSYIARLFSDVDGQISRDRAFMKRDIISNGAKGFLHQVRVGNVSTEKCAEAFINILCRGTSVSVKDKKRLIQNLVKATPDR